MLSFYYISLYFFKTKATKPYTVILVDIITKEHILISFSSVHQDFFETS